MTQMTHWMIFIFKSFKNCCIFEFVKLNALALLQGYISVNKRKIKPQIGTTVVRPLTSSLGFNL